jgi:hypothetical protein
MDAPQRDQALEPALRDIESIQSLDTARLALRWALERMRALERRAADLEAGAKTAETARAKTAEELDAARALLSRRAAEAAERERYYAKVEEYLSLRLGGGLDAAALAAREARLEAREAELQRREIDAERELKAVRGRFDDELKSAREEAAASADARVREVREEAARRQAERDRSLSERLVAAHEKEAQLASLERSLDERRRRFEELFAAQRAALEREAAALGQHSADQAEFLERRVEQALAVKAKAFESAWAAEKRMLLEELAAWRAKAREHLPKLLEAEAKAAALEDVNRRLGEESRLLRQAKETLTAELVRWRSQAQDDLPALLATVRRAVEAEEKGAHLEVELASVSRRSEEHQAELMSLEIEDERRLREFARLESSLAAKLRDAETELFRQYDDWLRREDEFRRRDQDWRRDSAARHESVEALRAEILAQREELTRAIAAYRIKAASGARGEDKGTGDER